MLQEPLVDATPPGATAAFVPPEAAWASPTNWCQAPSGLAAQVTPGTPATATAFAPQRSWWTPTGTPAALGPLSPQRLGHDAAEAQLAVEEAQMRSCSPTLQAIDQHTAALQLALEREREWWEQHTQRVSRGCQFGERAFRQQVEHLDQAMRRVEERFAKKETPKLMLPSSSVLLSASPCKPCIEAAATANGRGFEDLRDQDDLSPYGFKQACADATHASDRHVPSNAFCESEAPCRGAPETSYPGTPPYARFSASVAVRSHLDSSFGNTSFSMTDDEWRPHRLAGDVCAASAHGAGPAMLTMPDCHRSLGSKDSTDSACYGRGFGNPGSYG